MAGNYMPDWAVKETLPVGLNTILIVINLLKEKIILIYPQNLGNIQELKDGGADRLTLDQIGHPV